MKRCKHENHVTLTELGIVSTWHEYQNGTIHHNNDFHRYTGQIVVECRECGLVRAYGQRRPSWVKRWFEILTEA